jgi:ribosomal protein S18 acetylase RimI-like enzyme
VLAAHAGAPAPVDASLPELAAAVEPDYLGRGVGTRLLAAYLELARSRFPAVTLSVRADNPAVRLYQRAGFEVTGMIVNRVGTRSYAMIYHFR